MKKILLGAIAVFALSTTAFAADLPARTYTKAPAVVDPGYNWSGFYIGGNIGSDWASLQKAGIDTDTTVSAVRNAQIVSTASLGLRPVSVIGGVQAGYNWQSGIFVFGIEADANALNLKNNVVNTTLVPLPVSATDSFSSNYLVTVRPRVGVTFGPALFYVTGGLAVGNEKYTQLIVQNLGASFYTGTISSTLTGYTAGAGVEYAFAPPLVRQGRVFVCQPRQGLL
jgi:outer membrane immunogenic protein